jgi:hypothetical protein
MPPPIVRLNFRAHTTLGCVISPLLGRFSQSPFPPLVASSAAVLLCASTGFLPPPFLPCVSLTLRLILPPPNLNPSLRVLANDCCTHSVAPQFMMAFSGCCWTRGCKIPSRRGGEGTTWGGVIMMAGKVDTQDP